VVFRRDFPSNPKISQGNQEIYVRKSEGLGSRGGEKWKDQLVVEEETNLPRFTTEDICERIAHGSDEISKLGRNFWVGLILKAFQCRQSHQMYGSL